MFACNRAKLHRSLQIGTSSQRLRRWSNIVQMLCKCVVFARKMGGGPRVVVSTAAFHARVRGSVPGLGGLKETKNVSSPSTCESQYCGEPP